MVRRSWASLSWGLALLVAGFFARSEAVGTVPVEGHVFLAADTPPPTTKVSVMAELIPAWGVVPQLQRRRI